jgi:hypothetical protein
VISQTRTLHGEDKVIEEKTPPIPATIVVAWVFDTESHCPGWNSAVLLCGDRAVILKEISDGLYKELSEFERGGLPVKALFRGADLEVADEKIEHWKSHPAVRKNGAVSISSPNGHMSGPDPDPERTAAA